MGVLLQLNLGGAAENLFSSEVQLPFHTFQRENIPKKTLATSRIPRALPADGVMNSCPIKTTVKK